MSATFLESFLSARRVGTPLICVRTPDPAITMEAITKALADDKNEGNSKAPVLCWDCIEGVTGIRNGGAALAKMAVTADDKKDNPTEALIASKRLPQNSVLFFCNAQACFDPPNPSFTQACWNLRDSFKVDMRTLVMLAPDMTLPPELSQDVLVLDEPLPSPKQLEGIVIGVLNAGSIALGNKIDAEPAWPEELIAKAVDATCGLAAFPAEQVASMSLIRPKGAKQPTLNLDTLWDRKRQVIESTPGLSVYRGGEKFQDIGGVENAKNFFSKLLNGNEAPRAIVFLDEIEKAMAGATAGSSDSSGVSQRGLGMILSTMQDEGYSGVISVGPPGCAKSLLAKAVGNEGSIPTVQLDLGATMGSLVGQSERNLRVVLKVIKAVSQGRAFWIATTNKISVLPPELRRRFSFGSVFYDLPDAAERGYIWDIYLKKFDLPLDAARPNDDQWTGAEIKTCCDIAWRFKCSLPEAAAFIVPVAIAGEAQISELRGQAHGKFISASYPGVYQHKAAETAKGAARAISAIEEEE